MKMWWMLSLALAATAATAAGSPAEFQVKDPDGKAVAVIVFCNDCEGGGTKKGCFEGAETGFLKGKPCGECLLKANPKHMIEYPYDLHVTGTLTDDQGAPVKERFVKLFLSNGWGHRTKTLDKGQFHLMLGATTERKGTTPLTVDIGMRVDGVGKNDAFFSMYMLPVGYDGCSAAAAAPAPAAPDTK